MSSEETLTLYKTTLKYYLEEMYKGLSLYFKQMIDSPFDIEDCLSNTFSSKLKTFASLLLPKFNHRTRNIQKNLLQAYIAASFEKPTSKEFKRALELLHTLDPQAPQTLSWDQARIYAAKLRMQ